MQDPTKDQYQIELDQFPSLRSTLQGRTIVHSVQCFLALFIIHDIVHHETNDVPRTESPCGRACANTRCTLYHNTFNTAFFHSYQNVPGAN